jgi:beta-glucosidase
VAAARAAHTAVVFVWSGGDLSTPLPDEQDQLVSDVAEANPRTVVVLNTSQPVAMPWLERVQALLQMWFPGDEGGWATADVLLGRVNPGGHLPFTWPRALAQTVAHQPAHRERSSAGIGGSGVCAAFGASTGHNCGLTHYSEGVHVGYRFFDATQQRPLYPFGYGLSYTSFAYSGLRVRPLPSGAWQVQFRVHNTGKRAGDAVPQLYLGPPVPQPTAAEFPARSLVGFARVAVPAGESREVSLQITRRQLQYWSVTDGCRTPVGQRTLYLSADARHPVLQQSVMADR